MKPLISSVLTLSALTQLGCDPEPTDDTAIEERASVAPTDPAPLRATTHDPTLARFAFTADVAGGFVAADSDTIRVDAEGLAVRLGRDTMRFTLRSWGRADRPEVAENAPPRLGACAREATTPGADCARRVEQAHGGLTAWVARREGSVEQGWTLAEPPAGAGPVELRLAVTGGEVLEVEDGAAELATTGVRWRYAGLKAWDAAGKALPAHLERTPEGLAVIVDDTDARYPIEIDPSLSTIQVKLMALAPLQDPDYVIPEKYNYGAAIRDVGDLNQDGYDDVAVGAPRDYTYQDPSQQAICRGGGRVYLYYGSPLGIDPASEEILEPKNDGMFAYWAGSPGMPPTPCTPTRFGSDIAAADFSGDGIPDVVVGAPGWDPSTWGGTDPRGRVWKYYNPGDGPNGGVPYAVPMFSPSASMLTGAIGTSVDARTQPSVYGVASGPDPMNYGNGYLERVQAFTGGNDCEYGETCSSEWLFPQPSDVYHRFGHRVRFLGTNLLAIAAPLSGDSGKVMTYGDNDIQYLDNPDPEGARFGWDIDDAGDVNGDGITDLIVGAPGNGKKGSAYLYLGAASPPFFDTNAPIELLPAGIQPGDEYGTSVAGVGDINKDGFGDLVIGSPNDGAGDAGVAYLLLGSPNGPLAGDDAILLEPIQEQPNGFFGHRVSPAGDVNADKRPDVMVSACDSYHQATADGPGESGETYYWCTGAVFIFTRIKIAPPEATSLQLTFSPIKQFEFNWAAAQGATYYQLLERPTPTAGYQQIGGNIADLSITLTMPLHLRFGASYILRACNYYGGCTNSAPVEVVDSLATAVGYFKASNTNAQDWFGSSVALSADGTTLAVGAPREDSAATGINGDQSSNAAPDSGAVYVFVRQNGAWSQQAYVKASNTQGSSEFGNSLTLSADGNTLAVGAPYHQGYSGSVYVFTRSGAVWSQQAFLKASNSNTGDVFGIDLMLSGDGDTLAVGARMEDSAAAGVNGDQASNALPNAGAVYVFERTGAAWAQQAYVKASNPGEGDWFGQYLALSSDGDTLAVSALYEDSAATGIGGDQANNSKSESGAVYMFVRTGNTWSQQAYVKASNTDANDGFGSALALSGNGDTLAVGAQYEASAATGIGGNQASNAYTSGAAYVFTRTAAVWSQQAYVKASNTGANDRFGDGIALSNDGNTLAVAAVGEGSAAKGIGGNQADNSVSVAGAVYVYTRQNAAWSQRSYVKASNTGVTTTFGYSGLALSADGQTLAVGSINERSAATGIGGDQTNNSANVAGAVHLY